MVNKRIKWEYIKNDGRSVWFRNKVTGQVIDNLRRLGSKGLLPTSIIADNPNLPPLITLKLKEESASLPTKMEERRRVFGSVNIGFPSVTSSDMIEFEVFKACSESCRCCFFECRQTTEIMKGSYGKAVNCVAKLGFYRHKCNVFK
eukprot:GAHX01000851.1.p1 GENE.GAHX01000851.1~~GAHX01000851.1.p1  ORF type:complete len:146 (+),score=20.87 GAHX01000851.1:309-746(+)